MAVAPGNRDAASQLICAAFSPMKKCPTCNRQVEWQDNPFRPFCSERCQLVDLSKWVSEEYRVPGREVSGDTVEDNEEDSRPGTRSSDFAV